MARRVYVCWGNCTGRTWSRRKREIILRAERKKRELAGSVN